MRRGNQHTYNSSLRPVAAIASLFFAPAATAEASTSTSKRTAPQKLFKTYGMLTPSCLKPHFSAVRSLRPRPLKDYLEDTAYQHIIDRFRKLQPLTHDTLSTRCSSEREPSQGPQPPYAHVVANMSSDGDPPLRRRYETRGRI